MSMNTYPLHDHGLLIRGLITAVLVLADEEDPDQLPDEIIKLMDEGKFKSAATEEDVMRLPQEYLDDDAAQEILDEKDIDNTHCSSFEGSASSLFQNAEGQSIAGYNYDDDYIAYIPAEKGPDLFSAAYDSAEELAQELLAKLNGILPDNMRLELKDIMPYVCEISGTYFC